VKRSRQFDHLQRATVVWLQSAIPLDVELTVRRGEPRGFDVVRRNGDVLFTGRAELVAMFLRGYLLGANHVICETYRPDHNSECLNCDEWADAHTPAAIERGRRLLQQ